MKARSKVFRLVAAALFAAFAVFAVGCTSELRPVQNPNSGLGGSDLVELGAVAPSAR